MINYFLINYIEHLDLHYDKTSLYKISINEEKKDGDWDADTEVQDMLPIKQHNYK